MHNPADKLTNLGSGNNHVVYLQLIVSDNEEEHTVTHVHPSLINSVVSCGFGDCF